jgi:solute:Na+ symporter, SSS family
MTLHPIDLTLILLYIIAILAIGFSKRSKTTSDDDYLLAARKLSLPAFIMTLVTTWYGAIFGVGEFIFGYGIVGWITQGLFWYIVYFIFAFYFSKKIHDSGHTTVADHMKECVGKKSAAFGSLITFIMTTPAPYVLSLGLFLNMLLGVPLLWSLVLSIGISALYVWQGGFRSVVRTDILQFIFMFIGFGLLLAFSIASFGGFDFLVNNLPATHLTFTGGLTWQLIFVWGFLAFWTIVDPNFYARCYAAKDSKTAKKGVLYAIFFWFVFDMLTLFTALYARAAFPDADPLFSYLTLAEGVLPLFIQGLFLVTLISIIMSTIDSFLFSSSTIIASDILKKKYPNASLKKLTRIGIFITLVIALVLALSMQSVIGIIYAIGSVGVSALLIPMLLIFFAKNKLHDTTIFTSMLLSALVAGVWMTHGWIHAEYGWPVYLCGLEPMYVGLGMSAVILLLLQRKIFVK